MTVMAYRWRTLAADTLGTDAFDGAILGHVHKVGKTRDGWLWGVTGRRDHSQAFIDWVNGGRIDNPPSFDEHHSDHILISPDGDVKWWSGRGWIEPVSRDYHAWGCGRDLALGAMAMGANAYRAVEVACQNNVFCGGDVEGVSLVDDAEFDEVDGMDVVGDPIEPIVAEAGTAERITPGGWREKRGLR